MYYIGLISGTSMDAVDAALVKINGTSMQLMEYLQYPLPTGLQHELININETSGIGLVSRLDVITGKLFAEAVIKLLQQANLKPSDIAAIGSHGQTVLHRPDAPYPTSLQIADPNVIAITTGIPVVTDFRRMDMAAGGQGAPLAPIFHQQAFQDQSNSRVVLNIGGMANITCIPAGSTVSGFDTGPGNVLLDAWVNTHLQMGMDKDGQWAASGTINQDLLQYLLSDAYFALPPPKSTGRDYFNSKWLDDKLLHFAKQSRPEDIQATLVELTTASIANDIKKHTPAMHMVIVCGGGVHNPVLMRSLSKRLPDHTVKSTADFGMNPDAVEAMTFAWLARCRMEGIPASQPSVTGANSIQILGALYTPKI